MKKLLVTTFALFVALAANVGQSFAACGCGCGCAAPCAISCPAPCQPACCPAPCAKSCCPSCVTGCAAPCSSCCDCPKCNCDDSDKYCNVNGCCQKKSWLYRVFHRKCCGKNSNCGCVNECNGCGCGCGCN